MEERLSKLEDEPVKNSYATTLKSSKKTPKKFNSEQTCRKKTKKYVKL